MTAPRKDVKVYFDPAVHAALKVICSSKDIGLADYIEQLVVPHVKNVVHDVTVMADEFRRSGIARDFKESPGMAREGPGNPGISRDDQESPGTTGDH